ncbi:efflux RND transporter periplasmic adaptor subunit [uncultured Propionivibrio sp.]|uniref:efflux RND transporter periplasmic adaptor subunit n=1 Tax=uncultured Propionivibrio sp. TaxID=426737 RepID=UPI0029BFFAD1|nr:efflux RND transporter periplasmic adaptor subunit [uncultured Propionivibrio sp.]
MNKKLVWAALLIVAISGAIAWFAWSHSGIPQTQADAAPPAISRVGADELHFPPDAPQLTMIRAKTFPRVQIPSTDALSARLTYDEDATTRIGVGFSGRIVTLKAAVGDVVKAGQVLAEIDSPDFGTAYADLNKARADEERKRLAFERAKELGPGEAISVRDWEAAGADYEQARAETARAEKRIKNMNPFNLTISGQRVLLTSPIAGVVTERNANPALEVNPSLPAPLFVVTDPKRLWLMIDLPERLIAQVKPGSDVSLESDAYPEERFSARIVQLGQIVDPNTRRVTVRATLNNPKRQLLPEMFVRAYVVQDKGMGICVPNSAVINQGIYAYLYVEKSPGEFQRKKVTLQTRGGEISCASEGVSGDERVVVTGALLLDAELTARIGDKP